MENINFRGIPTSLFLNGPKLGIVTDPQDQSEVIGFATFTGIATVTAGAGGTMDAGIGMGASIVFKWYLDGSEVKDINIDNNSKATILGFSSATGYGTTITFNDLTSDDSGKEVYYTVDFVPTAYSQPAGTAVTVGSARSTANANNEPLQSESAVVTISPIIEVTSQPSEQLVSTDDDATFSVAGRKSPGNGPVDYQWQLNGTDLSDGANQSLGVFGSGSGKFTITRGSETPVEVDATQLSSYDNFVTGEIYTIVADSDIEADLFAFGADGDTDARSGNAAAGRGGTAKGRFTFIADQTYKLIVGKVGTENFYPGLKHGGGGQSRGGGDKSGGGFSGLFINEATQANSIIIAGGGGSAGKENYRAGGHGGFLDAANNSAGWSNESGGSQTLGGLGFYDTRDGSGTYGTLYRYMTGTALQGGYNNADAISRNGGGNGGGGYFGGGAGRADSNYTPGPYGGGGGSSFLHPTLITDGEAAGGTSALDNANNSRSAGEGGFRIEIVSVSKNTVATVTGSLTENLTINANAPLNSTIRCKLTATGVQESPKFSNTVSYVVVRPRALLKIEQYDYANESGTFTSHNLDSGSLTIRYSTHPGNAVCFYAAEKDLNVEIDMYAGPGDDNGPYKGGKGGTSRIQFTMKKEEEYIVTGLFSSINAPFLYRQSSLIAVVGSGGDAGHRNGGGDGGGIGIAGGDGPVDAVGGERIATGELPSNGIFGSLSGIATVSLLEGDTRAEEPNGGRTLPCPRGLSYPTKAPCELVGIKRFRLPNSTDDIPNSADISRGYKSGYNIIQTAGKGDVVSDGGNGGAGATGGRGGRNGNGGGGGSGYTDGSVTVFPDVLGDGSTDNARIEIRLQS